MDPLFITIIIIAAVTLLIGAIFSSKVARKQKYEARDMSSGAVPKHFILLNPILLAYALTVLAVIAFSYLFYVYFFS